MKCIVLFTDTIGGVKQTYVKFDYEYLKSIKRIRENRPAGEPEDDEYQERYFKREKQKGRSHRKEVSTQLGKYGFKPWVKEFKLGECKGSVYLQDGQNTRGAIIDLNEASLIENGTLLYDEFVGVITHYGDEGYWNMVDDMRDMNNCAAKWPTAQFTNSADEGRVRDAQLYINERTNLQEDQCTKLLFGDLNKSEYPTKKMSDARTYWKNKVEIFSEIYKRLDTLGENNRAKTIMTGDGFIVFNALLDKIYNYPSKNDMFDTVEEELEWSDERAQILIDLFCSMTSDGFQRNILLNRNSNAEIPYGRQKWYRLYFGRLFKNDKGCAPYYKSDKALKKIINEWATVEVNNVQNNPNYLKALPQSRL